MTNSTSPELFGQPDALPPTYDMLARSPQAGDTALFVRDDDAVAAYLLAMVPPAYPSRQEGDVVTVGEKVGELWQAATPHGWTFFGAHELSPLSEPAE